MKISVTEIKAGLLIYHIKWNMIMKVSGTLQNFYCPVPGFKMVVTDYENWHKVTNLNEKEVCTK